MLTNRSQFLHSLSNLFTADFTLTLLVSSMINARKSETSSVISSDMFTQNSNAD